MRRNKSKILAFSARIPNKNKVVLNKSKITKIEDGKRICIYAENGGVGDILMLTPSLKRIRELYPNSYIDLAIHTNGANDNIYNFMNELNIVNKVSDFRKINKNRYHSFIDVSEVAEPGWEINKINLRSRIDYYSELCGVDLDAKIPFVPIPEKYISEAKVFLKNYSKVFFIDTSSVDDRRCIPHDVILELITIINQKNSGHCILVSDWRKKCKLSFLKNVIEVTDKKLLEVSALIKESDYFFGPDSALMHIAAAVKTKSLVAFGMIPPEYRIATYLTHKPVRVESLPCLGCWYKPCRNNLKCMKALNAKEIYEKMEEG